MWSENATESKPTSSRVARRGTSCSAGAKVRIWQNFTGGRLGPGSAGREPVAKLELDDLAAALSGIASTTWTDLGALKLAISARAQRTISSGSTSCPAVGTTKASPTSPIRSSGTPTTATWATSGCASRRLSISAG